MRAVVLEIDERMLAERSRLGLDHRDEMWEGVLHVVPQPLARHQRLETELAAVLLRLRDRGMRAAVEMSFFGDDADYRVPDVAVYRPEHEVRRGIVGAELVVEIRSPGDESDAKIPW